MSAINKKQKQITDHKEAREQIAESNLHHLILGARCYLVFALKTFHLHFYPQIIRIMCLQAKWKKKIFKKISSESTAKQNYVHFRSIPEFVVVADMENGKCEK